jgi:putative transposase
LASTASFLGQELRVYYNSRDLRTVRAFAADGAEIGVLKAQGAWGEIAHDLKLRQEIVRLRGRKRLGAVLTQEFMQRFIEDKFANAKRTRRAANVLEQTLRTLAAAPTSATTAPPGAPVPEVVVSAPAPIRIEPQRLSVGTGFAGPI